MKPSVSVQILLILISITMLSIIAYLLFLMTTQGTGQPPSPSSVTATPTSTIASLTTPTPTDSLPSPTIQPTSSLTSTPKPQSDIEGIKNAFAVKTGKPASSVVVTVSQNTGTHAKGGISFDGEMGGGWFLAYKKTDGWIIVADGNGTISCSAIEPYTFPTNMVPECYDEKNDTVVKR
jgi:hypothetical protein